MTKNEKIRNNLFESYSKNINNIFEKEGWRHLIEKNEGKVEELTEFYYCPICGLPFLRESLNQNVTNPLTLEDVPPQKLGGKKIILTCKNCNNNLGGNKLDSKLIWDFKIRPFVERQPNSQIDAYYKLNERATTKGKLKFLEKGKFQIDFGSQIHTKLQEELDFTLKNWDKSKIDFRIQAPKPHLVNLALLRIAYLKMVAHFGFSYFFSPSSQKIRKQLIDPARKIIPEFGIPKFDTFPLAHRGIFINKSPKELKSFLVVFDLKNNNESRTYCVIMPGPDEDCISIYSELNKLKEFKFSIELILENDNFIYEKDPYALYKAWAHY